MKDRPTIFTIRLRAEGDDAEAFRLRRAALKVLWRRFNLKAVHVEAEEPDR
jgi:hypothetical protein